jgi:hypothetical protein
MLSGFFSRFYRSGFHSTEKTPEYQLSRSGKLSAEKQGLKPGSRRQASLLPLSPEIIVVRLFEDKAR